MFSQLLPFLMLGLQPAVSAPAVSTSSDVDPARAAAYQAERARIAARGAEDAPEAPGLDFAAAAAEALGVNELPGGGAVASGPTWFARWSDGRMSFAESGAAVGVGAASIEFELVEIVRESELFGLALDRGAATALLRGEDPSSARVRRELAGGVSERWDLLPEGAELSYALDVLPPGQGDLIVRLAANTDLVARLGLGEPARGLAFVGPAGGGVHVGAVTGIDAAGVTCDGRLAWDGARLELRLPAAFVDAAALPLVVDPTITGSSAVPGTGSQDHTPDAAWDEDTRTWAVAFKRRLPATCDPEIWPSASYHLLVQLFDITGAPKGTAVVLGTSSTPIDSTEFLLIGLDETPDIVNVNGRDEFAVVVATPQYCTPNENPQESGSLMHVLRVRASDGHHDMGDSRAKLVEGYAWKVALGAEPLPTFPNFLIAWSSETGLGSASQLAVRSMLVRLNASSTVFNPERGIAPPGAHGASWIDFGLALTASSGEAGRWLVAWSNRAPADGLTRIQGRVVRHDGEVASPSTSLVSASGTGFSAQIEDPRLAGHGTDAVLQYIRGGSQVFVKSVTVSSSSLSTGPAILLPGPAGGSASHDVAQLGEGFISVWTRYSGGGHRMHAVSYDAEVTPGSMERTSRWMPHELFFVRTRLAGMGESKPVEEDDQALALWKEDLGGLYFARILP